MLCPTLFPTDRPPCTALPPCVAARTRCAPRLIGPAHCGAARRSAVPRASSSERDTESAGSSDALRDNLGLSLGPIGLSLGPIGLSLGASKPPAAGGEEEPVGAVPVPAPLNSLSTEEWQRAHVGTDGTVDLWLQDDFNVASRMPGGRPYGRRENVAWSGKEAADAGVAVHSVRIKARDSDEVFTVSAPADRYVLFEAEEQGFTLPAACRMGCCTACAVKVKSGSISQPQALGLSAGLKRQGYALLCVGYAGSDLEVELQDPDEVYELQFGEAFAALATDPTAPSILRDDLALELAAGDE